MGRVAFSEGAKRPATSVRIAGMHGPWTEAIGKYSLANGGLPAIAFGFWLSWDGLLGASHATQRATPRHLGQKAIRQHQAHLWPRLRRDILDIFDVLEVQEVSDTLTVMAALCV